jgi:hypothetical protein
MKNNAQKLRDMKNQTKDRHEKNTTEEEGRKATTRSVSNMPDDWDWIDRRVKTLKPGIKGPSHYFQMLVQKDKEMGLLGPIPDELKDEGKGKEVAHNMASEVIQSIRRKKPRA